MQRDQVRFLFLNVGHFLDHLFMLIFATAAALRLTTEWGLSYAELIPYATPAFIASRSLISIAWSTTAFMSAPEKASDFLAI